jgi:hypothetical protein
VGDIIGGQTVNNSVLRPSVFLTSSEKPHYSLLGRKDLRSYIIYKVKPIDKVRPGYDHDELVADSVEVVVVVGSAKGFVERDEFGHVPFPNDPKIDASMAEFYREINVENPNAEGQTLLNKIIKKNKE